MCVLAGIGNEESVKVIAVDVHSGEVVSQSITNIEDTNTNSGINYLDVPLNVEYSNSRTSDASGSGIQDSADSENSSTGSSVLVNTEQIINSNSTPAVITTKPAAISNLEFIRTSNVNSLSEVITSSVTQAVKRQLASPSNPVVHKVIITQKPNSSQPQAVPIQLNQVPIHAGQTANFATMSSGASAYYLKEIKLLQKPSPLPHKVFFPLRSKLLHRGPCRIPL